MSARVDSSGAWVERWLTEPFERAGWRGVARRFMVGGTAAMVLWAGIAWALGGLIARLPPRELWTGVLLNEIAVLGAMGVFGWVLFRDVATLERWDAAGRPHGEAVRMLRLALTSPVRVVNWAFGVYLVVAIPTVYVFVFNTIEPLAFAIVWLIAGTLYSMVVTWPVSVFTAELATRPVIARVCADVPHLSAPEGLGMSLRTRALLPVPAVTLTAGLGVGGFVTLFDGPVEQMGFAIVASLVFAAAFGVILRFAATEAALRPVDDLTDGVERIASGDLDTRVAISSADELAVLGRAVNELAERLAAHDAEMRASRARIVAASDESRRRVERDLHDGAQQYLVLLELELGMLSKTVADDPEATSQVSEIRANLARALAELRDLAHGIYPAVLESDGLPGALEAAADRSSMPVTVEADGVGRHPQELESAIYFCCLEALQNAAKHAGEGAKAAVRLSQADGQVQFEVEDDGQGYDATAVGPSAGLQNMTDRIGALGGELQIESEPGVGTTVHGTVPTAVAT